MARGARTARPGRDPIDAAVDDPFQALENDDELRTALSLAALEEHLVAIGRETRAAAAELGRGYEFDPYTFVFSVLYGWADERNQPTADVLAWFESRRFLDDVVARLERDTAR